MSTLLLKIQGNRSFNRTLFPPKLFVYDDKVVFHKTKFFFWSNEITYSYNQIAQVQLKKGLIFAMIELSTTGTDSIIIKFVPKGKAKVAKKIVEQKVYHAHTRHHIPEEISGEQLKTFEKSLSRLEELSLRGKISKHAYKRKKADLLKKIA